MSEIKVRGAKASDAGEIYRGVKEAFYDYERLAGMKEAPGGITETMEDLLWDLERHTVLCALWEEKIAGSVRLKSEGALLYFYRFAVLPEYQGSGIGKALVEESERIARERGAKGIFLHTAANIEPLMRFYLQNGFSVGEIDASRGYPRARMEKKIAGE